MSSSVRGSLMNTGTPRRRIDAITPGGNPLPRARRGRGVASQCVQGRRCERGRSRDGRCLRREVGVLRRPDDVAAGSDRKQLLGRMRCEADDARGGNRQRDGRASSSIAVTTADARVWWLSAPARAAPGPSAWPYHGRAGGAAVAGSVTKPIFSKPACCAVASTKAMRSYRVALSARRCTSGAVDCWPAAVRRARSCHRRRHRHPSRPARRHRSTA